MSNYPAKIDSTIELSIVIDATTPISSAIINGLRDAIIAVETELGIKPSGINTSVKARLDTLDTTVAAITIAALAGVSFAGDLSGSLTSQNVIKLRGNLISATAPTLNYVLTWNGSSWIPLPNTPASAVGGDLSGNLPNPIVIKINSSSVPAGGALVTGNILQVTGISSLSYAPINLAGGINYVTGILPAINLPSATTSTLGTVELTNNLGGTATSPTVIGLTIASQVQGSVIYYNGTSWVQLSPGAVGQALVTNGASANPSWSTIVGFTAGGDLAGTSSNQTVVKINGSGVPAGGALTIGNGLYVTGVSTLNYGPLNLAGGSNYVIGTLPTTNLPSATTSTLGIIELANNLGGTAASPTVVDLTIASQVQGSVLYFNGTSWVQLSPGTNGQFLTTIGAAANPSWTTANGTFSAGGDLTGTGTSQTVIKINGSSVPIGGALTTGNGLYVTGISTLAYSALNLAGGSGYVTGTLPATNLPSATTLASGIIQLTNNLGGTATVPTVVDLTITSQVQGSVLYYNGTHWVQLSPGTNGQVLTTAGAAANPSWTTAASGFTAAGDLSGSNVSQTVIKINGSSVPAGGALTTGNGLYATGVSTLAYSALNLAGGSGYVTGTLPATNLPSATTGALGIVQLANNLGGTAISPTVVGLTITSQVQGSVLYFNGSNWVQLSPGTNGQLLTTGGAAANPSWTTVSGSFTAGGDLAGTSSNQTVVKINGSSVPAGGALVTGNGLYVTGVSTLAYSALNLAGGSGYVTGKLPVVSGGAPVQSQFVTPFPGITSTASGTYVTAATFEFDPTILQTAGAGTRLIKLRIIAETTAPQANFQLYNFTTAAVVTGTTLTTTSTTPVTLTTADLSSVLTAGLAIYQLQMFMAAGSVSDRITLDYTTIKVDWS